MIDAPSVPGARLVSRGNDRSTWFTVGVRVLLVVTIIAVWWILYLSGLVPTIILPSPAAVVRSIHRSGFNPTKYLDKLRKPFGKCKLRIGFQYKRKYQL